MSIPIINQINDLLFELLSEKEELLREVDKLKNTIDKLEHTATLFENSPSSQAEVVPVSLDTMQHIVNILVHYIHDENKYREAIHGFEFDGAKYLPYNTFESWYDRMITDFLENNQLYKKMPYQVLSSLVKSEMIRFHENLKKEAKLKWDNKQRKKDKEKE